MAQPLIPTIEFFLNYIKLAILVIKAYVGKSKIISAKQVTPSEDRTRNLFLTELTWQVIIKGYFTLQAIDFWT